MDITTEFPGGGTLTASNTTDSGPIPGTDLTAVFGRPRITFTATGLEDGAYRVDLSFMEWIYAAPSKRPLSVAINDQSVLRAFDVFTASGRLQLVTRSFVAFPVAGKMVIVISNDMGNSAILSGLKIRPLLDLSE